MSRKDLFASCPGERSFQQLRKDENRQPIQSNPGAMRKMMTCSRCKKVRYCCSASNNRISFWKPGGLGGADTARPDPDLSRLKRLVRSVAFQNTIGRPDFFLSDRYTARKKQIDTVAGSRYCSVACQRIDFKRRHRSICKPPPQKIDSGAKCNFCRTIPCVCSGTRKAARSAPSDRE